MISLFSKIESFGKNSIAALDRSNNVLQTGPAMPVSHAEDTSDTAYRAPSAIVTLSEKALELQKSYNGTPAFLIKDAYVSAPHRLAPDPATPLEDMVYRRDGLRINTETNPPRWMDSTDIVNYDEWLKSEQMIDQHVDKRIAIFKEGKAEGLTDAQIIQQIEDYNSTLPDRFHHDTQVKMDLGMIYRTKQWVGVTDESLQSSLGTRRRESYEQLYTKATAKFKTG
ncbi:hypothetical protein [uncultured Rheinheimera sp.]|uniref:hypothetical protein n=1 Tax=uncultured Rheinheimera sp. TaxID=400532 RepID=UPI00259A441F|nr:hypothetical protein [uncultured Rheinheimera sp.]